MTTPHQIHVKAHNTGENYCCAWHDGQGGAVIVTAKTIRQLHHDFAQSLRFHIQGCLDDGDNLPSYLVNGDYVIVWS